ncbi:MAG TPA: peptidylprolyl isomerase [Chitinophagaceae bacterium]|nr:peptidylprolyl isomerase [Chitinophagaceae bacterium]
MSFIQKIRDKYARIAVIAIALALLGFIMMDALIGRNQGLFGGGPSDLIGKVNGVRIRYNEFETKVKQQEDFMVQQGYAQPGETGRQQALEQIWTQEVNRILMEEQFSALGIEVGAKEINDILFGPNAPEDLKKQFTDPNTGQFDVAKAVSTINEMKKKGTPEQRQSFNNYVGQLEYTRRTEKFNSLIANSTHFPKWLLEKQIADNSQLAKISVVRELYSSVPDSLAKVSDEEIQDFINKHKKDYKQPESRSIAYVSFSARPSAADSAAARNRALELKAEFDTTTDVPGFMSRYGTQYYYSGYVSEKTIQVPAKDSIFRTPVGQVYGPYLDGSNYMLAKVEGARRMPDTVKVRHILIGLEKKDETGQVLETRDTMTARRLIDSVRTLISGGQNFDSVAAKLSEDPGSKDKGGVYENVPSGQMVAEFNDFIFLNPVGAKGVVKTEFGYHYIEVLSQKGNSTGYKIAYAGVPIEVSPETDQNASNLANDFAAQARDIKTFDELYEKKFKAEGVTKAIATDIKPGAFEIPGLGVSRSFVRNVYEARQGRVMNPEKVGDNYIVAVVTEAFEEGTQTASYARNAVEPLLRNRKKAQVLKQRVGNVTTLEAASAALSKPIETLDSLRFKESTLGTMGYEPRIVGASFNPENKGKVVPKVLEGVSGVFVLRVEDIRATPVADANVADLRTEKYNQAKGSATFGIPTALKNAAKITDNRHKIY